MVLGTVRPGPEPREGLPVEPEQVAGEDGRATDPPGQRLGPHAVLDAEHARLEQLPLTTRRLKITEIFYSLQGEADSVGYPTVFVRLTGCPLRCQYCDTAYAFHGGEWMSIDQVLGRVAEFAPRYVCVTGGETLAMKNCLPLLADLCDAGYEVSLETSGALPLAAVYPRVILVVDVKTTC